MLNCYAICGEAAFLRNPDHARYPAEVMEQHARPSRTLLRVFLATLVALGLTLGAFAVGHDEAGGAHHVGPVISATDPAPASDAPATGLIDEVAAACLVAMLCGSALLLMVMRLLRRRPLLGSPLPALLSRALALASPAPLVAAATPDLTQLSISRR